MAVKDNKQSTPASEPVHVRMVRLRRLIRLRETPTGKKLITISEFDELQKHKTQVMAIQRAIGFDKLLRYVILKGIFSQQRRVKEFENFMNGINMIQKARLANLCNLIDDTTLKDLAKIHEIRNKFAHMMEADFTHKEILFHVRRLSIAKDKKVTKRNSYNLYDKATTKCLNYILDKIDTFDKQNSKES